MVIGNFTEIESNVELRRLEGNDFVFHVIKVYLSPDNFVVRIVLVSLSLSLSPSSSLHLSAYFVCIITEKVLDRILQGRPK